jgi:hypothetical protein
VEAAGQSGGAEMGMNSGFWISKRKKGEEEEIARQVLDGSAARSRTSKRDPTEEPREHAVRHQSAQTVIRLYA